MPNPVIHFEIAAQNARALQDFYRVLFRWSMDADNPMHYALAHTKDDDVGIDGAIYPRQSADYPPVMIYAQVENADRYLQRAQELGGKIKDAATDMAEVGIRVGTFYDPEGNLFGVVQPLKP